MKAVIFDLDGVIVSTDRYHYLAWKRVADEEGIHFDETINNRLRGVSRMESLDIILERAQKRYGTEEKVELARRKNNYYRASLSEMSEKDLTGEVSETLAALRKSGLKLAIGSSSKNAKYILERIGLCAFFNAVSDGTNITRSKPDPEVFLLAAEMLGLAPKECLVVEDARAGIDAAVGGGFPCAAMGDASGYERADHSIGSLFDVLRIVSSPRPAGKDEI